VNKRYLAFLAAVASLILLVGVLVRRQLVSSERRPTPVASEASALQQLSMEGQLRRIANFVSERAAAVANYVEFLPNANAAGVRWNGDTVVSTLTSQPIFVTLAPQRDSLGRALHAPADSAMRTWVLVVGKRENGSTVSTPAFAAGSGMVNCGDRPYEQLLLGLTLQREFAGAAVFDFSGRLLGLVVHCQGSLIAATVREVSNVLRENASVPPSWSAFGFAITSLDSIAREYLRRDAGALVTRVRSGGVAYSGGLRPGDVIVSAGTNNLSSDDDVRRLASDTAIDSLTILRPRGNALIRLRIVLGSGAASPAGLTLASGERSGVAVTNVQAGTAAAAAGIRTGDVLLSVDGVAATGQTVADRMLRARRERPLFLVFERDSVLHGVFIQP
jgi:S1-C subfamily serine protease